MKAAKRRNGTAIRLTREEERRIRTVMDRGAYDSVEDAVDAALAAVEQWTGPGFSSSQERLDSLLAESLASEELTESEFWDSVTKQTTAILSAKKPARRS